MPRKKANIQQETIEKDDIKSVQKVKKKRVVRRKKNGKGEEMTPMQKNAVKKLGEKVAKGSKVVLAEVLQESGYSKKTARAPSKVFSSPPVVRELKRLKLTPEDLRQAHEDLFNSSTIEVLKYSIDVPPEDIIALIKSKIKGAECAKHFVIPETGFRIYEFVLPDRNMKRAMLELAYKFFPPKPPEEDKQVVMKTSIKQNSALDNSKNRLLLQKKLKLGKQTA